MLRKYLVALLAEMRPMTRGDKIVEIRRRIKEYNLEPEVTVLVQHYSSPNFGLMTDEEIDNLYNYVLELSMRLDRGRLQ